MLNAADRSKSTRQTTSLLSIAFSRSAFTLIRAVSVLCPALYAYCIGSIRLLLVMCSFSWLLTALSMRLPMNWIFETGL